MDNLFIEIEIQEDNILTSLDSFIALYVYENLQPQSHIKLNFVRTTFPVQQAKLKLISNSLCTELTTKKIVCRSQPDDDTIIDLKLPVCVKNGNLQVSGLCAVCREIISSSGDVKKKKLLGFKENSLLAPSENSVWTRFCEVNVIAALESVLTSKDTELLPDVMPRFENHMKEPVRMHNIYKLARENANNHQKKGEGKVIIECTTPKELLPISHRFAEGISLTIADIILYPCFKILFHNYKGAIEHFPLIKAWFSEVENCDISCEKVLSKILSFPITSAEERSPIDYKIPHCALTSLYKSDPKRYKPRNRIFTEQVEVDATLEKLANLNLEFSSISKTLYDSQIDWDAIETEHTCSLPLNRIERKRQQLGNLANAVISLAKDGDRIVDFCSGSGHLGILLALKLPKCTVIFLENKSISLHRAKTRAMNFKLTNCLFYQCNIDYFIGYFDIGTSLHACGTATDLVLKQCIRSRAKFVCCPCCYGSVQPMPHISYPLSEKFQSVLNEKDFLYIAHAADQAHELGTVNCKPEIISQGQFCMDIVDSDRKLYAEEAGYRVILTRLMPENCTPKNRLLVGVV